MNRDYKISIYLDTRRIMANGKYPVRLRVYSSNTRKQKLYPTIFQFTAIEFEQIWNTLKPRSQNKERRIKLDAVQNKAYEAAEKLKPFSFEGFEKLLYRKKGDGVKIKYHYQQIIQELTQREQLSTANNYRFSEKSIIQFLNHYYHKDYDDLTFHDISKKWLKDYEYYILKLSRKSPSTVGFYLRPLRAVYNKAIHEKEIEEEFYPFGKKKYQIPSVKKVKKALTKDQLKILFDAKPLSVEQEKARDFWFFSYACSGMNIKDMSMLKFGNIKDDKIEYFRSKTHLTSKSNLKPITVFMNDYCRKIIDKYGTRPILSDSLIFNVVRKDDTAFEVQRKIKIFTRYINQHIKKLCKANGLSEDISTYWARHSYATNAIRNGASMEFVQDSLGHGDLKTTQIYFAGFDSAAKKEFSEQIMNFG